MTGGTTIDSLRPPAAIGARYDRQFYTAMALAAIVVVYVGFSPTFFMRARFTAAPLPPYLQVHGWLFTAWIALVFAQTLLVSARRIDVHRTLGWAGAALASAMVVAGTRAGILSMRSNLPGQGDAALSFLTTPLFSMAAFAALVAAAIWRRRDPQTHKRLMLLATIGILDAAVARLPFAILRSSSWAYLPATDLFLAAAMLYDWRTRGRVHRAYIWGGLFLVVEQTLRIPVGETEAWKRVASIILGA